MTDKTLPELLAVLSDDLGVLNKKSSGVFMVCIATLTLLVEAKLLTHQQVVRKLQSFLKGLSETARNGQEGYILNTAIEAINASVAGKRPKISLEIISGGLEKASKKPKK